MVILDYRYICTNNPRKEDETMNEESNARTRSAILNAKQVAEHLGISKAGAYNLMNSSGFPTLRIGKRLLVPEDKFIKWIDENTNS